MPLVVHAEIDHASRLHGHAVDAARSFRPLHALGTLRSRGASRADGSLRALRSLDALDALDAALAGQAALALDALLAGLALGSFCALLSLVALGGDKQPMGTLHASGHVQFRGHALARCLADVGAAQPAHLLEGQIGLCAVVGFPYLHGLLGLLQRLDGVSHQGAHLGNNAVDLGLELLCLGGRRLFRRGVGVVRLHQQMVRHRDGNGGGVALPEALDGKAAPALQGQRLRRDGRVEGQRVLLCHQVLHAVVQQHRHGAFAQGIAPDDALGERLPVVAHNDMQAGHIGLALHARVLAVLVDKFAGHGHIDGPVHRGFYLLSV